MERGTAILILLLIALIIQGAASMARSLSGVVCLDDRKECRYDWEDGKRTRVCLEPAEVQD